MARVAWDIVLLVIFLQRIEVTGATLSVLHDGRVLTTDGNSSDLGTICVMGWDDTDASVVCRYLGLGQSGSAILLPRDYVHSRKSYNVDCQGREADFVDCVQDRTDTTGGLCYNMEDAGVQCHGGSNNTNSSISYNIDNDGRVIINDTSTGQLTTVCANQWDDLDATVICRHLNVSRSGQAMTLPPSQQFNKSLFGVHCTGLESDFEDCLVDSYDFNGTCQWAEDAGVQCTSGASTITPTASYQGFSSQYQSISWQNQVSSWSSGISNPPPLSSHGMLTSFQGWPTLSQGTFNSVFGTSSQIASTSTNSVQGFSSQYQADSSQYQTSSLSSSFTLATTWSSGISNQYQGTSIPSQGWSTPSQGMYTSSFGLLSQIAITSSNSFLGSGSSQGTTLPSQVTSTPSQFLGVTTSLNTASSSSQISTISLTPSQSLIISSTQSQTSQSNTPHNPTSNRTPTTQSPTTTQQGTSQSGTTANSNCQPGSGSCFTNSSGLGGGAKTSMRHNGIWIMLLSCMTIMLSIMSLSG